MSALTSALSVRPAMTTRQGDVIVPVIAAGFDKPLDVFGFVAQPVRIRHRLLVAEPRRIAALTVGAQRQAAVADQRRFGDRRIAGAARQLDRERRRRPRRPPARRRVALRVHALVVAFEVVRPDDEPGRQAEHRRLVRRPRRVRGARHDVAERRAVVARARVERPGGTGRRVRQRDARSAAAIHRRGMDAVPRIPLVDGVALRRPISTPSPRFAAVDDDADGRWLDDDIASRASDANTRGRRTRCRRVRLERRRASAFGTASERTAQRERD